MISFSSGGAVTNHGLIEGGGVYLSGGGVITNGASDATTAVIISSTSIAVNIKGATGRITNFGTIQNSGTHSAIYLGASGSVMNGSSGSTAALLKGGADGVHVGGSTATVTNFGTVDGVSGNGIALDAGGTITNRGLIEGGADGIYWGDGVRRAYRQFRDRQGQGRPRHRRRRHGRQCLDQCRAGSSAAAGLRCSSAPAMTC